MTPAEAVVDITAKINDLDFDSIKPRLNLYRKIAGFGSCRHHHN